MATAAEQASEPATYAAELDRIATLPHEAVIKAALECCDVRDFLRRLGAG